MEKSLADVLNTLWRGRVMSLPEKLTLENTDALIQELQLKADENSTPIVLVCDSHGGILEPAMRLADAVFTCRAPVVTLTYGMAASAAVHVFSAGRLRLMSKSATLGLHAAYAIDHGVTAEKMAAYYSCLNHPIAQMYSQYYLRFTRQVRGQLETFAQQRLPDVLFGKEFTLLQPEQAKALGLADGVFETHLPVWWKARGLKPRFEKRATAKA